VSITETVFSGGLLLAVPLALLAGLASFASPCILPLVPGHLGYLGGMGSASTRTTVGRERPDGSRRRLLVGVGLFIAGFTAVFVAYGALFGALGARLVQHQDLLIRILGVVVIAMGLVFTGYIGPLQRILRPSWTPRLGTAGAPLLGLVVGLGWTPCLGPTLVPISALSVDVIRSCRSE
jgi:cytochrome c-type biogenesis protein